MSNPETLGALRASGWESVSLRQELRRNAIAKIQADEPLFPEVLGYESTVTPQLENALLAGHDIIFLGERGQAKTRMIRGLTDLLDEWMPIVAGSEINDDPYNPISRHARELIAEHGDDTPIAWVHRDDRFGCGIVLGVQSQLGKSLILAYKRLWALGDLVQKIGQRLARQRGLEVFDDLQVDALVLKQAQSLA